MLVFSNYRSLTRCFLQSGRLGFNLRIRVYFSTINSTNAPTQQNPKNARTSDTGDQRFKALISVGSSLEIRTCGRRVGCRRLVLVVVHVVDERGDVRLAEEAVVHFCPRARITSINPITYLTFFELTLKAK